MELRKMLKGYLPLELNSNVIDEFENYLIMANPQGKETTDVLYDQLMNVIAAEL